MTSPLFGDTITVYNHLRIGRESAWKRTVIRGVQIYQKVKNDFTNNGESVYLTETSITIPYTADSGGKAYVPPDKFTGEGWTLNPADGQDVIILRECEREIGPDYSVDMLIKEYGAFTIKAATDNTRRPRLRTWKVVCV